MLGFRRTGTGALVDEHSLAFFAFVSFANGPRHLFSSSTPDLRSATADYARRAVLRCSCGSPRSSSDIESRAVRGHCINRRVQRTLMVAIVTPK